MCIVCINCEFPRGHDQVLGSTANNLLGILYLVGNQRRRWELRGSNFYESKDG
jgi:hypothetical protein